MKNCIEEFVISLLRIWYIWKNLRKIHESVTISLFWHFSGDCDTDLAMLDSKPTDTNTSLHLST